jgi:hypothetical protein
VVAKPRAVPTLRCPEAELNGTLVAMLVDVADVETAKAAFSFTRSLVGFASKFVPLIVIPVPTTPMLGVKLVMVGAPFVTVTVKGVALVADPVGAVTLMGPLVAPFGTVARICVAADEVIDPGIPLKSIAF